jgi:hypothetical protein
MAIPRSRSGLLSFRFIWDAPPRFLDTREQVFDLALEAIAPDAFAHADLVARLGELGLEVGEMTTK